MAELIRKWRNEIPQTSRNFTSSQFCKFIQNTKLFNSTPPKQKSFYKKWPLEIFTFVFGSSNWIPSWKKDFPGIYCPLFSPNLMDARFTDPEGHFWMLYPDVSDFGFYIFDGRRFHIHIKMRFIVNLWTYRSGPKENPQTCSFREGIPPNLPPNNSLHRPPRFFQTQATSFWRCKPLPRAVGYGIVGRGSSCVSRFASSRVGHWSVQGSPGAVSSAVTASDHLKRESRFGAKHGLEVGFQAVLGASNKRIQYNTIQYRRIKILCCNSTRSKMMTEELRFIVFIGITAPWPRC